MSYISKMGSITERTDECGRKTKIDLQKIHCSAFDEYVITATEEDAEPVPIIRLSYADMKNLISLLEAEMGIEVKSIDFLEGETPF